MTQPDDDLRTLLRGAVSDVHPDEGLEAIRARTSGGHPPGKDWLPIALAAAVAVVLVMSTTVWLPRVLSEETSADPDRPEASSTLPDPNHDLNVPVLYVGATADGPRLFTEYHEVHHTAETPVQVAVSEAMTGRPHDPDYRNYLRTLGVDVEATEGMGQITLDLSSSLDRPRGMSAETAQLVVQSLVWTAEQASYIKKPVRFTVHGQPVARVLGEDASAPIEQGDSNAVLAPVSIESPDQDAHVPTSFRVQGWASVVEGDVVWELVRDGEVVQHGFTTAEQCCHLAPFSFSVEAEPGTYTLLVHDTDESDGEGVGISRDSKAITVE